MKLSLRSLAIVGLLCLAVLGTACGGLPSPLPAYETPPGLTEGTGATLPRPTLEPYPIPTRRPTPTPGVPPTKGTPSPSPIPTATPPPTALPLPPSAFDVLWVKTTSINFPSGSWGAIWRADPRDIANRQQVVCFADQGILEAALSPNGQMLALTTAGWHWRDSPLWVVNLDGTGLQQVAPDAGQILWSPNSRAIFYTLGQAGPPTKLASASRQDQGWVGIERVDLATGEIERILTIEGNPSLQLLGWSAGGQWLYHIRRNLETREFELWETRQDGSESRFILPLGLNLSEPSRILLSPEGGKLLIGTRWISTDGQERGDLPLPGSDHRWVQVLWDHGENKVIVGQYDANQLTYHLYAINIQSQHVREIASIAGGSIWELHGLSPDYHWVMAFPLYRSGFYWVHLPTETIVPIPSCPGCWVRFVAWIPSGAGR